MRKNTSANRIQRPHKLNRAELERRRLRDLARLNDAWRVLTAPGAEHVAVLAGIVATRVAS